MHMIYDHQGRRQDFCGGGQIFLLGGLLNDCVLFAPDPPAKTFLQY